MMTKTITKVIVFTTILFTTSVCFSNTYNSPKQQKLAIALTLLGEARCQGEDGMRAVAQVIYNRSVQRNQSFKEVCFARKQFSFWNESYDPDFLLSLIHSHSGDIAWSIATDMVDNGNQPYPELGKVNHYHATYVSPYWAKGKNGLKIKTHIFYYF